MAYPNKFKEKKKTKKEDEKINTIIDFISKMDQASATWILFRVAATLMRQIEEKPDKNP